MNHILFLTDFSSYSNNALRYALELAKLYEAKVILFNAFQLPHSKSNVLMSLTDRMQADSKSGLEDLAKKIRKDDQYSDIELVLESRRGGLISLVKKLTNAYKVNLLVMGTKGASDLEEMFMGSDAMAVIRATRCPVLAVPEEAKFNGFNKILFATDLLPLPQPKQLDTVFEFAEKQQATLQLLHIIRIGKDDMNEGKAAEASALLKKAGEIPTSIHFETNPDVINGISDYIDHSDIDIFAMISRKHSLFERIFKVSKTSRLGFRSKVPALIMND